MLVELLSIIKTNLQYHFAGMMFIYLMRCMAAVTVRSNIIDANFHTSAEICTDVVNTYTGHRNIRTFLKDVTFIGLEGEYLVLLCVYMY